MRPPGSSRPWQGQAEPEHPAPSIVVTAATSRTGTAPPPRDAPEAAAAASTDQQRRGRRDRLDSVSAPQLGGDRRTGRRGARSGRRRGGPGEVAAPVTPLGVASRGWPMRVVLAAAAPLALPAGRVCPGLGARVAGQHRPGRRGVAAPAPTAITLTFNEPVSVEPGGVRLLEPPGPSCQHGRSVDNTVVITPEESGRGTRDRGLAGRVGRFPPGRRRIHLRGRRAQHHLGGGADGVDGAGRRPRDRGDAGVGLPGGAGRRRPGRLRRAGAAGSRGRPAAPDDPPAVGVVRGRRHAGRTVPAPADRAATTLRVPGRAGGPGDLDGPAEPGRRPGPGAHRGRATAGLGSRVGGDRAHPVAPGRPWPAAGLRSDRSRWSATPVGTVRCRSC